jgi:hypothetical protein
MIPEAELIRKEIIVRQLDIPQSVLLTKNSLLRWCALSLGLISPNETRDKGIMIFDALMYFFYFKKHEPSTQEINLYVKEKHSIELTEKLVRYHLGRLIDMGIIQRKDNTYVINPSPESSDRKSLAEAYSYWVKKMLTEETEKTGKALAELEKMYSQTGSNAP